MRVGAAFDLEGTSVDLESARHQAHLSAASSFGIVVDREFAVAQLPHFVGGPDDAVAGEIFDLAARPVLGSREEFVREFLRRDTVAFENFLASAVVVPRPGLREFIGWLEGLGVQGCIGSLTSGTQARVILERSGLAGVFGERVVLREHVQNLKPAPDVFFATARILNVNPQAQLVFEDSPRGVSAALAAGSHPIGMPVLRDPSARRALERSGPLAMFEAWTDLRLRDFVGSLVDRLRAEIQDHGAPSPV